MKLTVTRLGHHGDGIAETDAGPLFLPMTLPGEEVEATPDGDRARDIRILTPSPDRVKPPCPHFRRCGGCSMQHVADAYAQEWKTGIVRQALAAQGLDAPITAYHMSPPSSRRRASLTGRRTRAGAIVGFHERAGPTLFEIPDCRLLRPELMACLPVLAEIVARHSSRDGTPVLTVTLTDTGIDLSVTGAKPLDPRGIEALVAETAGRFARIAWNDEVMALDHTPALRFGTATVPFPPGAFLQATVEGEAALTDAVRRAVGPARTVVDLFAGIGTFALPLARDAEVDAFEGEAPMVEALDRGWRGATGLHALTATRRDLFRRPLDADELRRYDAAVIDPPRAGAEAQSHGLAASGLRTVAMVSCNPATFARDARLLTDAGFRIDWIEIVDQFRWSAHVELAARLVRP